MSPGRTLIPATEVEMTVIQEPAPEKFSRAPAGLELSGGDAIEQLPDGPPLARGNAGVERHVLWPKSRFAPHSLHTISIPPNEASAVSCGGSGQIHGYPTEPAPASL